jgi:hypothetical protein
LDALEATNKELLEATGVEPAVLEELNSKNAKLQEEAAAKITELEEAKRKNQELLKKVAISVNELGEAHTKYHELLEEASTRTAALEEANAKHRELLKDELIRAAALEEVNSKNAKLQEEAAAKITELEEAKRKNQELVEEGDSELHVAFTQLAHSLKASTAYAEHNFESVGPFVAGIGKTGQAHFVGDLRFAQPVSVIIDDVNNKTVDLYTAVINEAKEGFESAVYGEMFGSKFFVGATISADESSTAFYFARFQSPAAVICIPMDVFLSDWVPQQSGLKVKLDLDERQVKAMEAIAVKFFQKPTIEPENLRKSCRNCPRLVSPGRFGAAAGDGEFISPADDGGDDNDSVDASLKTTPLKVYKVGSRKGLCVAYKPESKSPVVGVLVDESERHSRVKVKLANGTIRTYDMKNIDVLPLEHRLYTCYRDEVRKFELDEADRLARQREIDSKASLQEMINQTIIQAKNDLTEVVQKLLPPRPPTTKKAAQVASESSCSSSPNTLADVSQVSDGGVREMIHATVAEALKAVIPHHRSPSPRRRSPEHRSFRSSRHAERPDSRSPSPRRRSPSPRRRSPSPRRRSPSPRRRSPSPRHRSPSNRRRSPEHRSSRSSRYWDNNPSFSPHSSDLSPSPESGTRKRAYAQSSLKSSRDSKHRRR